MITNVMNVTPSIAAMDLCDKDILVIRFQNRFKDAESRNQFAEEIREVTRKAGKKDVQVLILEQGMELSVLSPA